MLARDGKPLFVDVKTACALTGFGYTRFYELLNEGTIRSFKIGRKRLIPYEELENIGKSPSLVEMLEERKPTKVAKISMWIRFLKLFARARTSFR